MTAPLPRPGDMVVTRWGARFGGRHFPVSTGRGGFTSDKREGDGATPVGVWRLASGAWRPDRGPVPRTILPMSPIGPRDVWSDDPADPGYNHWQRGPGYPHSHEALRMAPPLYDMMFVSDWNWPEAEAGRGSAIFVHVWRGPRRPTAGCLAFRKDHLRWIMARWTTASRIIVRDQAGA